MRPTVSGPPPSGCSNSWRRRSARAAGGGRRAVHSAARMSAATRRWPTARDPEEPPVLSDEAAALVPVLVAAVFRSPLAHRRDDGAHLSRAQSPEAGRILGQRVVVVVEDALDVVVPCDDPRADLVGVVHGVGLAQQRVARVRIVEHRLVEQGAGSPMPPDRGVRSAQGAARVRVKRAACRSRAPHRLARAPARP
jgi:hypothetical protein